MCVVMSVSLKKDDKTSTWRNQPLGICLLKCNWWMFTTTWEFSMSSPCLKGFIFHEQYFLGVRKHFHICGGRKAHIVKTISCVTILAVEWSNLHLFPLRRVGSGLSQINFVSADQIRPLDPVNLSDGGWAQQGMWWSTIKLAVINQLLFILYQHRLLTDQLVFINEHHGCAYYLFWPKFITITFYYSIKLAERNKNSIVYCLDVISSCNANSWEHSGKPNLTCKSWNSSFVLHNHNLYSWRGVRERASAFFFCAFLEIGVTSVHSLNANEKCYLRAMYRECKSDNTPFDSGPKLQIRRPKQIFNFWFNYKRVPCWVLLHLLSQVQLR